MIQIFTPDDVVRFVYNEMDETEACKIREAMLLDDELMDICQQLVETKHTLDVNPVIKEPSYSAIYRVLEYSKTFNLEEMANG